MRSALMSLLVLAGCVDASIGTPPVAEGDDTTGEVVIDEPDGTPDGDPSTEPTPENAPMISTQLSESSATILNPERGFYVGFNLATESSEAAQVRAGGHTLAISIVRLDAYRASALPESFLQQVRDGFADVRDAGIKVILRF